jgi:hypothetical protein
LWLAGYNAANKAATIYASYLETDDERKRHLLMEVAQRCEEQQQKSPKVMSTPGICMPLRSVATARASRWSRRSHKVWAARSNTA